MAASRCGPREAGFPTSFSASEGYCPSAEDQVVAQIDLCEGPTPSACGGYGSNVTRSLSWSRAGSSGRRHVVRLAGEVKLQELLVDGCDPGGAAAPRQFNRLLRRRYRLCETPGFGISRRQGASHLRLPVSGEA